MAYRDDHMSSDGARQNPSPPLHMLLPYGGIVIGTSTDACEVSCVVTQCRDCTSASGIKEPSLYCSEALSSRP